MVLWFSVQHLSIIAFCSSSPLKAFVLSGSYRRARKRDLTPDEMPPDMIGWKLYNLPKHDLIKRVQRWVD